MHPETPFAANGLGRLGGGKTMLASGIGLEGNFSGANFAVKLSKRVKTRGFCLRGTFFSSP